MGLLRPFLRPHLRSLRVALLLEAMRGLAVFLGAAVLARLVELALLEGGAAREAMPLFLGLFLAFLCRSLLERFAAGRMSRISLAVQEDCRKRLHGALLAGAGGCAGGTDGQGGAGRILALATETVGRVDNLFRRVLPDAVSCLVLLPLLLGLSAWLDPIAAAIFLVTLPIAPFLLYLIGHATRERNLEAWQELERLQGGFYRMLRGIVTLKAFGRAGAMRRRLRELGASSAEATLRVLQLAFVSAFALELATTLAIALVAVSLGLRLLAGYLEFFPAFLVLLLAPEFYRPVRQGGASFHAAMEAGQAAEELQRFAPAPVQGPPGTRIERAAMPPALEARRLFFAYPGKASPVLRDLDALFEAGTATALAGASGCGKSTLLKLMAGLLEPQGGELLLAGLPVAGMERASLSRLVAYVPQQPHVFRASLRDNLSLFRPLGDGRLWDALRRAGLEQWAKGLPGGLEAPVDAASFSSGQLRRLGLARAILRDAHVLLLDEPTAGLDPEGERELLALLGELCCRRTAVIASHRPALLRWAPRVVTLDGGRAV